MSDPKKKGKGLGFRESAAKRSKDAWKDVTPEERAAMRAEKEEKEKLEQMERRRQYLYNMGDYQGARSQEAAIENEIDNSWTYVPDPEKAEERDAEYKAEHEATATRLKAEIKRAIERGNTDAAMVAARELARDQYGMETDQIYAQRFGNMPYHDNRRVAEGRGYMQIGFPQEDFDWQGSLDDKYYWDAEGDPALYREGETSTIKSGLNARLNEERRKHGSAGQAARKQGRRDARENRIQELAQANYDAVYGRLNQ